MTREDFVEQVKACGQSVIDNADKIYNNFQYSSNGVEIMICVNRECIPEITVVNRFLPETFIELAGMRNQIKGGKHYEVGSETDES